MIIAGTDPDAFPGKERVVCLTEKTGRVRWIHQYDCPYTTVAIYAIGPRATPTVDEMCAAW